MATLNRGLDLPLSLFERDDYRFSTKVFRSKPDSTEPILSYEINAFRKFFEDFYPSVFTVAAKFIDNKGIAEELSFETFAEVLKRKKKFRDLNALKDYIYSNIHEKCIRYLKIRKKYTLAVEELMTTDDYFFELILREETYRQILSLNKSH